MKKVSRKFKAGILKQYFVALYIFFTLVWGEMSLRVFLDPHFLSYGIAYMVVFDLAIAVVLSLLISLIRPEKYRRWVLNGLMVGMYILFSSQFLYFRIFHTFYSFYSLLRGGQVAEFGTEILQVVLQNSPYLLLMAVPLGFYVWKLRVVLAEAKYTKREWVKTFVVFLALHVLALGILRINPDHINSPYSLYYEQNQPIEGMNKLGLLTQMRLDFSRTALGQDAKVPLPEVEVTAPWEEPESTAGEVPVTPTPRPEEAPLWPKNVLDINFAALIAREESEEILELHRFFQARQATAQNAYTGMFKDYNLIYITAESFSSYAIDPELTPTLYRMQEEGFKFENFYTPLWGVSTLDGEYVNTQGLLPKAGVWSMLDSSRNYLPFTFGNQFRTAGFPTYAYHNHTYTYYNRDKSHPNLGYEYKGVGNGLEIDDTWPESDLQMMEQTVDDYLDETRFHAYYLTVSGHMDYSFEINDIAQKNEELVRDLAKTEPAKAYMATQIELDRALEYLLERLEEAGQAERTLIVLAPDHHPYGLANEDLDNLAGKEVEESFELYRNSLLIYAKGMTPEVIERPVSNLDILPTVSNLLGLTFDSRLLSGRDAFSAAPALVIFNNRNFVTELGFYSARDNVFAPVEGATVPEGYVEFVNDEIQHLFTAAEMILENDYYSRLGLGSHDVPPPPKPSKPLHTQTPELY